MRHTFSRSRRLYPLAPLAALLLAACASPPSGADDGDGIDAPVGTAAAELAEVPGGVGCIGIVTSGVTNATRLVTVTRVPGLPPAVSVVTGDVHACALTTAGSLFCWGDNAAGDGSVWFWGYNGENRVPGPPAGQILSPTLVRL